MKKKSIELQRLLLLFFFSLSISYTVFSQPIPGIKANGKQMSQGDTISVCVGAKVTYQQTAQNFTTIKWRFNNGLPSTATGISNQVINYNNVSIDTTWQIVINGAQKDSMFIIVKVSNTKPVVNFNFLPDTVCGYQSVAFTNQSIGTGLIYLWNFGDGGTSTLQDPTYTFLKPIGATGTTNYNVKLYATNDEACTDSVTKNIVVYDIPNCSISNADPNVQLITFQGVQTFRYCVNSPSYQFSFKNASTLPSIIRKYTIHWGDGSPDSIFTSWPANVVVKHTFPRGNSLMKIEVEGKGGCIGIVKDYNVFIGTNPAIGYSTTGNNSICAPDSLKFIVSGFQNNPLSTIYTVTTNDGTPIDTFKHPPPDTVRHYFNISSCGLTTLGYSNAYSSVLRAENACGGTSVPLVPIYISSTAKAKINIGDSNFCANSTVAIVDGSDFGSQIIPTGGFSSTCTKNGNRVWSISPASGFNITSGSLGTFNGTPTNSTMWTNGSNTLNVNFITPGNYVVKVYVANNLCGKVDSAEKKICIRVPSTASFTKDKTIGCGPDTVTFTNTSSIGSCSGDKYNWIISFIDPAGCSGAGSFSFVNGTTSSSINPQIRFVNPGKYIIKLQVNAIASGCSSPIFIDTFYVKGKPKISLGATAFNVCVGNSITPIANVTNCYSNSTVTYLWNFSGGVPSSSNSLIPGSIAYNNIGNNLPITLQATNECGTSIANATVNVTPLPVANAGPDMTTCSGNPVQIGVNTGAFTYSWSPATGLSNPNAAIPLLTRTYNGPNSDTTYQYILTVSTAGVGCIAKDTVFVKIKKKPTLSITPLSKQICPGTNDTIKVTGADSYTWSPSSGLNTTSGDIVIASPNTSSVYTVTGTFLNGCSASAVATVNVVPLPTVNAGVDKTVCSGTPVSIGVNTGNYIYSWMPTTGLSNSSTAVTNVTLSYNGVNSDTTYQYVLTAATIPNGCTKTDTVLVKVIKGKPVANAGVDTFTCSNVPVKIGINTGNFTYNWSPSTGLDNPNIATPTVTLSYNGPNSDTTYRYILSVSAGGGFGCSSNDTIYLKVKKNPIVSVTPINAQTCPGATTSLLASGATTYIWSPAEGLNNINGNKVDASPFITTTYSVAGTLNGCTSTAQSIITILPSPLADAGPDATICSGNSLQIGNNTGNYTYGWSPALGLDDPTIATPTVTRIYNGPSDDSTYRYIVTVSGGMSSCISKDTVLVKVKKNPTVSIDPINTQLCNGGSVTLTATGAGTYIWSPSTGLNVTSGNSVIASPLNTTTYTVSGTFNGCTSTTQSTININALPIANAGPDKVICSGASTSIGINTGNYKYRWNTADGLNDITIAEPTVTLKYSGANSDTTYQYFVTVSDLITSCNKRDTVLVKVKKAPVANAGPDMSMCSGSSLSIGSNTGNYTYGWSPALGLDDPTIATPTVTRIYNGPSDDSTYRYIVTVSDGISNCTSKDTVLVKVKKNPTVSIDPINTQLCNGGSVTLTAAGADTYVWSPSTGLNITSGNSVIASSSNTTTYTVSGAKNGCTSTAQSTVSINASPIANAGPDKVICSGAITSIGINTGNYKYQWNTSSGLNDATLAEPTVTLNYNGINSDTIYQYVVTVSDLITSCIKTDTVLVKVKKNPTVSIDPINTQLCNGGSVTLTAAGADTYLWSPSTGLNITSGNTVIASPSNTTTYAVSGIINGCTSIAQSTVSINASPIANAGSDKTICSGAITSIGINTGNYKYQWNTSNGLNDATLAEPTVTLNYNGINSDTIYQYVVTVSDLITSCTKTDTVLVKVKKNPTVSIDPINTQLCNGGSVTLTAAGADTYVWSPSTGLNITSGNTVIASPSNTITYTVSGAKNGCTSTAQSTVSINASPIANAGPDKVICSGAITSIGINTGNYKYQWNTSSGLNDATLAEPTVTLNYNGINSDTTYQYVVTVSIGINSCYSTDTVLVKVKKNPNVSVTPASAEICGGSSVPLIANGADIYAWSPSNGLNSVTGNIVIATPSFNTIYTVTGSLNGCTSSSQSAIKIIDPPKVNAGNDIRICRGQTAQLKATGANNWLWSPAQTLSCFACSDPIASPKLTTVYTVKGNNGSCEGIDSVKVEVIQPFKMDVSKDTFICIGDHIQLIANNASKYLWQPAVGLNRDDIPNPIANPLQTTLYKLVGTDQYSCFSDTQFIRVTVHPLPTVDLGYGSTVIAGTQLTLNPIINSIDPVNYYKWTPAKDLSCDDCKNPVATINNNVVYTLNIKSIYGCGASDTIHYKVNCDPSQVFIPNVFSPDGDGINDILMIRAKGVAQIKYFRIYNRWGQLIFERSNITANDPGQGWDGKVNGMPSNPDVYVYMAEVLCSAGNTYIYKGNVTLLK